MSHRKLSAQAFTFGALAVGLSACTPDVTIGTLPIDTATSSGPGAGPASCSLSTLAPAHLTEGDAMSGDAAISYADGWVYFATTPYIGQNTTWKAQIWRVPVHGGAAVELQSGVPDVRWLKANTTDVFIGEVDGSVWRMPVTGGAPTLVFHGLGADVGSALTITSTDLVLANGDGSVRHAPIGGGSAVELYPPTQGDVGMVVTADASNVYWFAMHDSAGNGDVMKVPLAGGPATVMMSGRVGSIVVRDEFLYVSDIGTIGLGLGAMATGDGTIFRMPIDQSEPPTILASNQPLPFLMAVDASGVYWGTVWGSPSLNHIALDGGAVVPISPTQGVMAITPCADGICWVDSNTNSVVRYEECSP